MIPTTWNGILVLLIFLLPGFAYTAMSERHGPTRSRSVFRETGSVLFASAAGYAAAAVLIAVIAFLDNAVRHDVLAGLRSFPRLYAQRYLLVDVWMLATVVLVTAGAAIAGSTLPRKVRNRLRSGSDHVDPLGSAWWIVFDRLPDAEKNVSATLTDGTWISGALFSWSRSAEETPDREIVLSEPILVRAPGSGDVVPLRSPTVVLSARQILYMTVDYFTKTDAATVKETDQ